MDKLYNPTRPAIIFTILSSASVRMATDRVRYQAVILIENKTTATIRIHV
jgi:hypothetical protein